MSEEDPLDGVGICETEIVHEENLHHGINSVPDSFFGSDRLCDDYDIVEIEVVEREGDVNDFIVHWEGEVTKRLPRYWDRATEPRTEREKRQQRREEWGRKAISALATVFPLGIGFAVAVGVSRRLGSITINGETVALAPSVSDLFAVALIVVVALLFVKQVPRLIAEAYKSGQI
ncbi:hypothetical protein HPS36_01960 [Halorubrum salinarum]|uniref:Uncharacterized protein n=1 Tax=Halorubrum salinarum TaxID=2739057 RepID=A0A7D3YC71_9EURY|nr:hypothetical protein [Halorubrum salinarum]QKG91668.1 hypothetical protein HPS36_01960 [Halorubrum salinarum]